MGDLGPGDVVYQGVLAALKCIPIVGSFAEFGDGLKNTADMNAMRKAIRRLEHEVAEIRRQIFPALEKKQQRPAEKTSSTKSKSSPKPTKLFDKSLEKLDVKALYKLGIDEANLGHEKAVGAVLNVLFAESRTHGQTTRGNEAELAFYKLHAYWQVAQSERDLQCSPQDPFYPFALILVYKRKKYAEIVQKIIIILRHIHSEYPTWKYTGERHTTKAQLREYITEFIDLIDEWEEASNELTEFIKAIRGMKK